MFIKFLTCLSKAREFESIKIIRYEESVYYANVENFKYKIMKMCQINPDEILAQIIKAKEREEKKNAKTKTTKSVII